MLCWCVTVPGTALHTVSDPPLNQRTGVYYTVYYTRVYYTAMEEDPSSGDIMYLTRSDARPRGLYMIRIMYLRVRVLSIFIAKCDNY